MNKAINEEITRQINSVKSAVYNDLEAKLKQMQADSDSKLRQIQADFDTKLQSAKVEILRSVRQDIKDQTARVVDEAVKSKINPTLDKLKMEVDNSKAIVPASSQLADQAQLALVISKTVEQKVLKKIDEKYAPKLDKMGEWLQYNTQDTDGLVADFRRATMGLKPYDPNMLLTAGPNASAAAAKNKIGHYTLGFDHDHDDF